MPYPYFNNYQPIPQTQQGIPQLGQNMPAQQSPFVTVRSEAEARNYPVGFGNSVMFKDETSPYVYTKTMGFSQLDKPVFEKYRLIKEDAEEEPPKKECHCENYKDQISNLESQINSLWKEIDFLKERRKNNERTSNAKSN